MFKHYLEIFNQFIGIIEELLKTIVFFIVKQAKLIKNFQWSSINYDEFAMNFFYLRDVEFEDFIMEKDEFNKYNNILRGISKINKNYSTLFEEKFTNNLSVLFKLL